MKTGRKLTAKRMVKLAGVSRASFYRFVKEAGPGPDPNMDPKKVYRLMREDNLLCFRKRKFVVTTDSSHQRKI